MKKIFSSILISILTFHLSAQEAVPEPRENNDRGSFFDNVFFGGGFGLQFGNQTYIEVAPQIGYKFTNRFSAGLGLKYIYYKFNDNIYTYSTHIYGGGPFTRFFVLENLFLHAEYEILNLEVPDAYYREYTRKNISSVFVGAGYRQMIGTNSSIDLLLLYNINETRNTPYQNPIFRIGFGFGL
jgi:hypothetical protein